MDTFIAAAVDKLPIGVGVVDKNGRVIARCGGLAGLLSARIPSSPDEQHRWRVIDEQGRELPPSDWPAMRALRGEEVRGLAGAYTQDDGGTRHVRFYSAPMKGPGGEARALLMVQDASNEQMTLRQMQVALEKGVTGAGPADASSPLTNREREVLRLFAWGFSRKDVASRLSIAVKTAEFYQAAGMRKLGLKNRIDVVTYAMEQGWLTARP